MASKYSMNDRPSWPRRAIVTAGEPYGNKGLHFGHVGGVFVPADFFARFLRDRLGRENVIFTSGTDCYGSPIMEGYRKKVAEREISSAEDEARRIINEAIKAGETKKRESVLEAKDEIHRQRVEADRELKERRNETQQLERRLIQREEALGLREVALDVGRGAVELLHLEVLTNEGLHDAHAVDVFLHVAGKAGEKLLYPPEPHPNLPADEQHRRRRQRDAQHRRLLQRSGHRRAQPRPGGQRQARSQRPDGTAL